jgi:hypothetical protein
VESLDERIERRKHRRFLFKDAVFAACDQFPFGVGALVDISRTGVSFEYSYYSGEDLAPLEGVVKLHLFKNKPSLNVVGIECNVRYDTAVPWENGALSDYPLRRCGVQFGELSRNQSSELDLFIKNFTLEEN